MFVCIHIVIYEYICSFIYTLTSINTVYYIIFLTLLLFDALFVLSTLATAIQIMELIADKKGIDKRAFTPIHADIERMKKAMGVGAGVVREGRTIGAGTGTNTQTGRSGDRPRPPPGNSEQREAKRPRM